MNRLTQTIDADLATIYVDYSFEKTGSQIEDGGEVGFMTYTELNHVWLDFAGKKTDILSILTEAQKETIISTLKYE